MPYPKQKATKKKDNPNVWTPGEKILRNKLQTMNVVPTRFADRELMNAMGIKADVENLLTAMGVGIFASMDNPTFIEPCLDFLATVDITFPKTVEKAPSNATLRFKIKSTPYSLSMTDVCDCYGFNNGSELGFGKLGKTLDNLLWDTVADGDYSSRKAKMTLIRNPVLRYTMKLLANTLFARHESASVTTTELLLLFKGTRHLLRDRSGNEIEDVLGNDTNMGYVFAKSLVRLKEWATIAKRRYLHIGGVLTPLLAKAGVDLTAFEPMAQRLYVDKAYLIQSDTLFRHNAQDIFVYRLTRKVYGSELRFKLPDMARTTLLTPENLAFEIIVDWDPRSNVEEGTQEEEEGIGEEESLGTGQGSSSSEPIGPEDIYAYEKYTLPDNFKPKTKEGKILNAFLKVQKRINRWQSKMIGKLTRRMERMPFYNEVESDEEGNYQGVRMERTPYEESSEGDNEDEGEEESGEEMEVDEEHSVEDDTPLATFIQHRRSTTSSFQRQPIDPPRRSLNTPSNSRARSRSRDL